LTLCAETASLALTGSFPPLHSDFSITYLQAYTIVLAILIAMIATTVAFFTFFRLRAHWQDNFIKRTACALVLAIAVCGEYRSYILRRQGFGGKV
jgi:NO-binding membrane sensor protein with MHYT domain